MAALLSAIAQAWDGDPGDILFLKEGGSGPEADLVEQLGAPLLFLGAGLPTDRIHSPNERVLLPMLHRGAEAAAHLWRELAATDLHPGAGS
jgi:acetylornithine deacetylase/succinyl-diaminopimelate desuccinylase-like protein